MRIAILSDIHGNLTAFEAVLADIQSISPDLILHGGDLAHGGSRPAEVVDRIRDLGWLGVAGNTDEMLSAPHTLEEFASARPASLQPMFEAIREIAAAEREALGEARLAWLEALPRLHVQHPIALVHASPDSTWNAPGPDAGDAQLASVYAPLDQPFAVYGHIHRPFVRALSELTVVNTGSVSLSCDGDRRASYFLLDESGPSIRRVDYDIDQELKALNQSALPHSDWIAKMLATASPQMP